MAKKKEGKKSIPESKYDAPLLRKLCEEGVTAQEAKKSLNLSSMQSLRSHLMRFSVEDNCLRTLPGLYERSNSRVRLSKNGIKITPKKLEAIECEFGINSEFTVHLEDDKIILSLVGASTGQDEEDESRLASEDDM